MVNNATLIFNRSDALVYSGTISGTGALTKQGGGTLTLAGANSYSGVTTIFGGTLALSGAGSIGTGGLNLGSGGVFDLTALTSGTYSLPSTGDLIGSGTLTGNGHTLAVLGAFQPGNSPGTVTVDTGFTLDLSGATSTTFDITDPLLSGGHLRPREWERQHDLRRDSQSRLQRRLLRRWRGYVATVFEHRWI